MKYFWLTIVCAAVIFTGGCRTPIEELPAEQRQEPATAEYKLARELLTAFLQSDGKKFVSLLPAELQERFPLATFNASRKTFLDSAGEPISFRYVTTLELPPLTPQIWKIRFRRVDRKKEREYTSEMLFRIITTTIKNEPVITSFQFL